MTAAVVPDGTHQVRLDTSPEAGNHKQEVVIGSTDGVKTSLLLNLCANNYLGLAVVPGVRASRGPHMATVRKSLGEVDHSPVRPGEHPIGAVRVGDEIQASALAEDLSRTVASFEAAARKLGPV